ncbi:ComEC/Rec2 family competence protein [Algoriphagus sp. NG3]|uniref:ComEC/Rec2 family competence protein n=1 Tax=Algoriphagus sp. NG3 TaxID=3097546 RepID=UPI002A7F2409|nr:MBL fold metallo-hydrolase [Algoriphagus sp. NG3]WPR76268.1 hypothetical protein SLW71_02780 [Algoriphagus sp. NG3]
MKVRFLNVGCGDCIHVLFTDTEGQNRNILIDGGVENGDIYDKTLRKVIESIVKKGEVIDLWIITHIDDDHIGGILRLLKDDELFYKVDLSKTQFWYNYSNWDYDTGIRRNNLKSVKQGVRLRDFLIENSLVNQSITDQYEIINLWGAKITILSPNQKAFSKLSAKWKKEEIKIREKSASSLKLASHNDYNIRIEDFNIDQEQEDSSVENGSSIAFLLEYKSEKMLLTADSHPNKIADTIQRIWIGQKITLKYMQIPHHGSKYNTSKKLLDLIDCREFIISGDAYNKHNLPNKETMVKYIKAFPYDDITFHVTARNPLTEKIFEVDKPRKVNLDFPKAGNYYLEFELG